MSRPESDDQRLARNVYMDLTEKKHNRAYCWVISLAVNLVILAAVLCSANVVYETNDDFAISQMILAGYPYVGFVNYYLCKLLIIIQCVLTKVNVFVLSQIAASFFAMTAILKLYLDRTDFFFELIPAVLTAAFFSFDHYSAIQFTKTAALLMTAGLLYVVDNYTHERRPVSFIMGAALFWLGVAYRQKGMFPALGYAACFMFVWWMFNGKSVFKRGKALTETGLIILILVMLLSPYGFDKLSDHKNVSTDELRFFREYQSERVLVTDYPLLDYYEENVEKYEEEDLSYNDLEMIDRWLFDYDGAASLDNLKAINEINRPYIQRTASLSDAFRRTLRKAANSVKDRDFNGMHIAIAAAIALYILLTKKPEAWLYVIGIAVLSIAVYTAIVFMQRPQYRALYVADESAVFWLFYTAIISENFRSGISRAAGGLILIACSALVIYLAPNALASLDAMYDHNKAIIEAEDVTAYFASHKDSCFIEPTTTICQPASYATPLHLPLQPDNHSDTGGWETLSPYKLSLLDRYGIKNPIKDLINAENIFFFGDSKKAVLTEYYNKWYCDEGEWIEFVKVDEINGNNIYSVIKNTL